MQKVQWPLEPVWITFAHCSFMLTPKMPPSRFFLKPPQSTNGPATSPAARTGKLQQPDKIADRSRRKAPPAALIQEAFSINQGLLRLHRQYRHFSWVKRQRSDFGFAVCKKVFS
jgi:hypothetical protein